MTQTWKQYVAECKANNVEPTRADFNGVELTDAQLDARILRSHRRHQPRAMAATA